jgi:hypothetical protein
MTTADHIRRKPTGLMLLALVAVLGLIAIIWSASRRTHERQPMLGDQRLLAAVPAGDSPVAPASAPATASSASEESEAAGPSDVEIATVITSKSPALKVCYQRALARDDKLVFGSRNVDLSIGASGAVKTIAITGTPDFRVLDPCLKAAISKWRFPEAAESYHAQFPLQFRGSD